MSAAHDIFRPAGVGSTIFATVVVARKSASDAAQSDAAGGQ